MDLLNVITGERKVFNDTQRESFLVKIQRVVPMAKLDVYLGEDGKALDRKSEEGAKLTEDSPEVKQVLKKALVVMNRLDQASNTYVPMPNGFIILDNIQNPLPNQGYADTKAMAHVSGFENTDGDTLMNIDSIVIDVNSSLYHLAKAGASFTVND